jgi:hypothetical protein
MEHFTEYSVGKSSRLNETEQVNTKLLGGESTNVIQMKLSKLWIMFSFLGYLALGQLTVCTKQRE